MVDLIFLILPWHNCAGPVHGCYYDDENGKKYKLLQRSFEQMRTLKLNAIATVYPK